MATYEELVGVYNAEGTIVGELRYVIGRFLGTAHCALCDITHGALLEKRAHREFRGQLSVPLRFVHLDDQGKALASVTKEAKPCVVGRCGEAWHIVIDHQALTACAGEVEAFRRLVEQVLEGEVCASATL